MPHTKAAVTGHRARCALKVAMGPAPKRVAALGLAAGHAIVGKQTHGGGASATALVQRRLTRRLLLLLLLLLLLKTAAAAVARGRKCRASQIICWARTTHQTREIQSPRVACPRPR
jgi:hypothetical protein